MQKKTIIRKLTGILCLIISALLTVMFCSHYVPIFIDYKKSADLYDNIRKSNTKDYEKEPDLKAIIPNTVSEIDKYAPIEVDSESLLNENPDYLGWIYIPGTDISYPVVKSADNSDYLHTDFHGSYSFPGTIFMDSRCISGILNHHSILYGHNMNNGTMFAGLKYFQEQEYLDDHQFFWFITPRYKLLYQIFSVCYADPYDSVQYGIDGFDYKDNTQFGEAMNAVKKQSLVQTYADSIEDTAYVMSLSTCTSDSSHRCVVHGILIRNSN